MYAWVWRHLPFGLRGKIAGSLLIVASIGILLWFVVFPVIEPKMPFNDGQIDEGGGDVSTSQEAVDEEASPEASGRSASPATSRQNG
ncbi:MAG: hypothetical protein JXA67_05190 [Micromonosporaceae bacterium]|nr:hypothetical protein [Micromonosporaceae bacterium]